ncbi:phage tail tube protein [Bacillaceae bacterium Marseille-Q3522]|nr:phage tail tube protein [Bacillaceae bacterium Marseille-Q3522]
MGFLKAKDIISGQEGTAFATINGRNVEMFYVRAIEATVEKQKSEVKTLGKRGTQHKTTGWTGSGSMTIYAVTSEFIQMAIDYVKNGVDTYFDIKTTNSDPTSSIGRQTVVLLDVNLDSIPIVNLDTDTEFLEQDLDFTFDDLDLLEKFQEPTLG